MDCFIDLESGILNNSICLEEFLASIKGGVNTTLSSLPFNSNVIWILREYYSNQTDKIFILFEKKNSSYAEMCYRALNEFLPNIILIEKGEDRLKTIENFSTSFDFISTSIYDFKIIMKSHSSSMIGNIFSYVLHFFIANRIKESRNLWFEGFFTTFFRYFQLIIPIFTIWPTWMEVDSNIINLNKMSAVFITSLGFCSFFNLFRSLINLDSERFMFQQNKEIFCCSEFIVNIDKIRASLPWLLIFFLFGFYGFIMNPFGFFVGLSCSIAYFFLMFSSFKRKWTSFLLFSFLINVLSNPTFAKKLFKLI